MRVIIYNIHKGIGGVDRRYQLSRIIDVINYYQPDVALLQEVMRHSKSSSDALQVEILGEAIGLQHRVWVPNVRVDQSTGYGNAIFSRWPITESSNIDLTVGPKKRRSALYAKIRTQVTPSASGLPHTRTVHFFNLHLGLSGIERKMQLRKLLSCDRLAHLSASSSILVAGDMNDVWGSLGRQVMKPAGFRGTQRKPRTFPAYAPVRPLDSVYVRGPLHIENLNPSRLSVARQASDHLPLIAEISEL